MIDLSHLVEAPGLVQSFGPGAVSTTEWQSWTKPRGFVMLSLYAIGAGGGGGGGRGNAANAGKGGGGGGSSGVISRLTIPLFRLPDVLWYRVVPGGAGGAGGSSADGTVGGAPASATRVAVYPDNAVQYQVLVASAGLGGVGGTTTVALGGSAPAIVTTASCPVALLGAFLSIAGIAGTAAGTGASNSAGGPFTQTTGSQILPGTGGAGSSTGTAAGGVISALANTLFIANPGGVAGSGIGSNGFRFDPFPKYYGGTGGGSSNTVTGGAGGNGCAPGTGGGGGGGGVTVGGRGGDGGPGLVVFHCWGT